MQKWHGPTKFYGPNTQYETVAKLMEFGNPRGNLSHAASASRTNRGRSNGNILGRKTR